MTQRERRGGEKLSERKEKGGEGGTNGERKKPLIEGGEGREATLWLKPYWIEKVRREKEHGEEGGKMSPESGRRENAFTSSNLLRRRPIL